MSTFYVADGQFWLDGQPQWVQAGEFHYFRTPADQWAHRLGLLQAAGFNTLATYIPWLWHQTAPTEVDFDGHTHPMRNLEGFLDLAADMGFFIIPRPGPYIMAETINEGIPPWVFQQHSQIAVINQAGETQNLVSYLHPDFLGCVAGWYRSVFAVLAPRQITRGGKIILIQLDNEMGMMSWVRNILDLNPDTLARFAAALPLASVSHASGLGQTGAPALSLASVFHASGLGQTGGAALPLVDFLREGISHPASPQAVWVVEAYRRFYRDYLHTYAAWLWAQAQAQGMEVLPVINIHGFGNGGKTFPIGLSQLAAVMGIPGMLSATDVYPISIGEGNIHQLLLVNEMTKALHNPQQPLLSLEFQAGGNNDFSNAQSSFYDLHTRLCLSTGMRGVNHYLFCDGENDPILSPIRRHDWGHPVRKDGSLRSHYARYPKLSGVIAAYGAALLLARPRTVTTIGFLLDDFMTEVNTAATQEAARILTHQRDMILFDLIARGLTLTHRPFTALDLDRGDLDPARTPVCWVMMERSCCAETQAKLAAYVRQGGKLILIGRMCVEDFAHTPCTILQEALGITLGRADAPFTPAEITVFDHAHVPVSFVETYTGDFDTVFATRSSEQNGAPTAAVVGFSKRVGQGEVLLLGAALAANTLEDLDIVAQMAARMGVPPLFTLSAWADVRLSEGEAGSFLYVNNYGDDPVTTTIACAGASLFDGHPIRLPARSGAILPLAWRVQAGIVIHYLTAEVTGMDTTDTSVVLHLAQAEFKGELSLDGWECELAPTEAVIMRMEGLRIALHGQSAVIRLRRVAVA